MNKDDYIQITNALMKMRVMKIIKDEDFLKYSNHVDDLYRGKNSILYYIDTDSIKSLKEGDPNNE